MPFALTYARLSAGVLFLAWLLSGCSTLDSTALIKHPPTALATRAELTDTPFFPQEEYQCGPAALATVLKAKGRDITPT